MILYLDTSALVKLYVQETGSFQVREAVGQADLVATCRVAYVEACAAAARKRRLGELTGTEHRRFLRHLEADWERLFLMEVSDTLTRRAARLVERHPLRGYDALHLASALLLKDRVRVPVRFLCFDARLHEAAVAEGLEA